MTGLMIGLGAAVAALLGTAAWRRRGGRTGTVAGPPFGAERAGVQGRDGVSGGNAI